MSDFNYVTSKLGNVAAKTRSIAKEIFDVAANNGHDVWFMWGMGPGNEHGSGYSLDFMVRNEAAGDFIRNYIWEHRARLGLIHVIWEQHITSTRVSPGVRRLMEDRGDTTQNHYDHVHVWWASGSYVAPSGSTSSGKSIDEVAREVLAGSWGNGDARKTALDRAGYDYDSVQAKVRELLGTEPANIGRELLRLGSKGQSVMRLQSGLRKHFPLYAGNLAIDGDFGKNTDAAVRTFQARSGLEADGVVGLRTRIALEKFGINP